MTRILVVEDEQSFSDALSYMLRKEGFEVAVAGTGPDGLTEFDKAGADLVLLDLMLPGLSGLEVCRQLRQRSDVPVIMLTAKDAEVDKVVGLEIGADDYVTKPFSARELLARVRVLGRRAPAEPSLDEIRLEGAVIDLARMIVVRGDEQVALTPREVGIVRWLHRHRDRVVSRAELLEQVFGQRGDLQTRAVDMAIAVLRKKLEADPARPTVIVSIKGAGYAWRLAR